MNIANAQCMVVNAVMAGFSRLDFNKIYVSSCLEMHYQNWQCATHSSCFGKFVLPANNKFGFILNLILVIKFES